MYKFPLWLTGKTSDNHSAVSETTCGMTLCPEHCIKLTIVKSSNLSGARKDARSYFSLLIRVQQGGFISAVRIHPAYRPQRLRGSLAHRATGTLLSSWTDIDSLSGCSSSSLTALLGVFRLLIVIIGIELHSLLGRQVLVVFILVKRATGQSVQRVSNI